MKHVRRVLLVCTGMLILLASREPDDLYFLIKKNFTIFSEVYREVSTFYVDAVDPSELMRTGISAMLSRLDPYTVMYDEGRNQQMEILSRGEYGGVGIEVDYRNGDIIVVTPLEGTSAARMGIRPGDVIKKINTIDVTRLAPNEIETLIAGEIGTSVNLTIKRYGIDEMISFELMRERVVVNNVVYHGLVGESESIGYVNLAQFGDAASAEVAQAITELKNGRNLDGLILDLRNNPGGLLNEAVDLSDLFLPANKEVVRTKGRLEENNSLYTTVNEKQFEDLPVVILINGGSASASEIVAGALQDWDRAVVVGEQSFGKGLVQIIRPIAYNHTLKITTSRYYIPSGRSIQSIDYSHSDSRNGERIADSLRKEFKTKGGRKVYDGAGIYPDVEINEDPISPFLIDLLQKNHLLFFVNSFSDSFNPDSTNSEILFSKFSQYLKEANYEYHSQTEMGIADLMDLAEHEGFGIEFLSELGNLEAAVKQPHQKLLVQHKEEITNMLVAELTGRFLGQASRKKISLKNDPVVDEAVKILTSEAYSSLLKTNG